MGHVTLKSLLAHKFRLVLTSIAVVLGVAFMAGTFVLTDTLGNVFDDLFTDTTKGVDVVVRSREPFKAENDQGGNAETRPPVPASLEQTVQRMPGVKLAQGSVFEYALVIGKDGKAVQNQAPTFGTSWHLPPRVNQSLDLKRGRQPRTPAQVALDLKTAEDAGYRIGDQVTVSFQSAAPRKFELTGIFEFGGKENGLAGATLAAFTPPTAQQVINRVGQWDEIQVRGDPGLSEVGLRDQIRTELRKAGDAKKYEAITGEQLANEQSDDLKSNLSFFNTFLLIFALVALFVGAFIIYNTFSITVAQRTRELGLLRALGASGRQVVASVALEALAVGVLSAVLGLALGIAIVKPLEALLSAFGIDLPSGSLQILPRTIVVSFLVGALVTVVSSLARARRARPRPVRQLRPARAPGRCGRGARVHRGRDAEPAPGPSGSQSAHAPGRVDQEHHRPARTRERDAQPAPHRLDRGGVDDRARAGHADRDLRGFGQVVVRRGHRQPDARRLRHVLGDVPAVQRGRGQWRPEAPARVDRRPLSKRRGRGRRQRRAGARHDGELPAGDRRTHPQLRPGAVREQRRARVQGRDRREGRRGQHAVPRRLEGPHAVPEGGG